MITETSWSPSEALVPLCSRWVTSRLDVEVGDEELRGTPEERHAMIYASPADGGCNRVTQYYIEIEAKGGRSTLV